MGRNSPPAAAIPPGLFVNKKNATILRIGEVGLETISSGKKIVRIENAVSRREDGWGGDRGVEIGE